MENKKKTIEKKTKIKPYYPIRKSLFSYPCRMCKTEQQFLICNDCVQKIRIN